MKKIILASSIFLLAAACNKAQPANNQQNANTQPQVNLTQTYTNTSANYAYKYPDNYSVDMETDSGMLVAADSSANGTAVVQSGTQNAVFQINPVSITPFTQQSVTDYAKKELSTVSSNVTVSTIRIGNMNGYKAIDGVSSDKVQSDRYYFQNSADTVFELIVNKGSDISTAILNSFSFTK